MIAFNKAQTLIKASKQNFRMGRYSTFGTQTKPICKTGKMKAEEKAPYDILPKFRTLMFKLPYFLNGFIMVFSSIHKLKLQSRALLFKSIQ